MTVLVTGGRGFLARHLLAELGRRFPRARIVLTVRRAPEPGFAACDLLDPGAALRLLLELRPSAVFHLAGTTRALGFNGLWEANVSATLRLLEAAGRLPRPDKVRIVVAGSAMEYGGAGGGGEVTEDTPPRPLTPYGAAKLSQTLAALSYAGAGLHVAVARIFNVLGPGLPDHQAAGAFARQLALIEKGRRPPRLEAGDLRPRRDFVDCRDVARGLADVAEAGRSGEIYNVCSGRAVSIRELLRRLLSISGSEVAVRAGASRRGSADVRSIRGSHRKLTALTGWKPSISLDRSLQDTLEWHRGRP